MLPAAGIVRIHAHTMRSITPSRSARGFLAKHTPMIAVEMLWVVDTDMPKWAASVRLVAELVAAAKQWIGCSLTILWPMLLMIFQPQEAMPIAIPTPQVNTTPQATSCHTMAQRPKPAPHG